MTTDKIMILDTTQVDRRIKRIAYEIYERNFEEQGIIFAGINGTGYAFAERLVEIFRTIAPYKAELCKVTLDKHGPANADVQLGIDAKELRDKSVILVDDVLNSGRTLLQGLKPFLDVNLKKIETAVLVNRSHLSFPVAATYSGYELATTLNDHIEVEFGPEKREAYLR
ncbi:phosphoribosyltransferase [Fulvitalea axinellae]|uniref:Phosphoribosyltransferase n=1 Tax=Fulvitalea axinellae TaxID=1182444 RepID=A0AAU9D648_9BACT|nr:phosphoribosyltransferase [Fulvitalea axinellae]